LNSFETVAQLIITFYFVQKIRTVEQDGKTIKLQIVCIWLSWYCFFSC